jgi:putative salt-induced outer membrane protein
LLLTRTLLCTSLTLAVAGPVRAEATDKPDGQIRAVLGLGASLSSGNNQTSNLSLTGDAVRATADDKITLYGNAQYARSAGITTAEQARLGGRYDHDLSPAYFAFGGLDFERNRFVNLSLRSLVSGGLGWHAIKSPRHSLDLFGGLGYTSDNYLNPMMINGERRESYRYATLPLGEESTHRLTETTSVKQRLVLTPKLKDLGEYRATWDAGLSVTMSKVWSLTVGFSMIHNSNPGVGIKPTDTLLTTGVSVKFD